MTDSASPTAAFRAARDLLLSYRDDYESARRKFTWPELDEFNWALDWFDVIAGEHPDRPALRIVADDGFDVSLSYGELATRSGAGRQLAARPRRPARRPGAADARQRGAAVGGHPGRDEARRRDHPGVHAAAAGRPGGPDRAGPGPARHHRYVAAGEVRPGAGRVDADRGRRRRRPRRAGRRLARLRRRVRLAGRVHPGRRHPGQRPAAALLHLGHHGSAQARRAHAGQLPGGAPVHDVLDRHPAGRRAPEPVLAGLGQARLEQRVRAVERGRAPSWSWAISGSRLPRCSPRWATAG